MNRQKLEDLLLPGAKDAAIYRPKGRHLVVGPWDRLARENPIRAAAAALDEEGERMKTASTVDRLVAGLNDGIVLDLGCGYGRIAKYLLPRRVLEGYIGLDASARMLGLFEERYASRQLERRTPMLLIQSTIDRILLLEETMDNVVINAVLLHNPKPMVKKAIHAARRVLKPGGKLFVLNDLPNVETPAAIQGVLYLSWLSMIGRGNSNGPVRRYSRREVELLFQGFSELTLTEAGLRLLPKGFPGVGSSVNGWYRRVIFSGLHAWGERNLSESVKRRLCTRYEVVAIK